MFDLAILVIFYGIKLLLPGITPGLWLPLVPLLSQEGSGVV
jgi:hypothetical protein